jgi:hypothetical protein
MYGLLLGIAHWVQQGPAWSDILNPTALFGIAVWGIPMLLATIIVIAVVSVSVQWLWHELGH